MPASVVHICIPNAIETFSFKAFNGFHMYISAHATSVLCMEVFRIVGLLTNKNHDIDFRIGECLSSWP